MVTRLSLGELASVKAEARLVPEWLTVLDLPMPTGMRIPMIRSVPDVFCVSGFDAEVDEEQESGPSPNSAGSEGVGFRTRPRRLAKLIRHDSI